jgi:hypothetical protein
MILVGTRSDLAASRRAVSYDEAKAFADDSGMSFFETSTMDGTNCEIVFTTLASEIVRRLNPHWESAGTAAALPLRFGW